MSKHGGYGPFSRIPSNSVGSLQTLTHLPLDKMAAISRMIFWVAFSWMKSFVKISLKFAPKGPIDKSTALV